MIDEEGGKVTDGGEWSTEPNLIPMRRLQAEVLALYLVPAAVPSPPAADTFRTPDLDPTPEPRPSRGVSRERDDVRVRQTTMTTPRFLSATTSVMDMYYQVVDLYHLLGCPPSSVGLAFVSASCSSVSAGQAPTRQRRQHRTQTKNLTAKISSRAR